VQVYRVNGPFFFGAACKLREVLNIVDRPPRVMILQMDNVPVIDATGLHALEEFERNCKASGTGLILAGVNRRARKTLEQVPLWDRLGPGHIVTTLGEALDQAARLASGQVQTAGAKSNRRTGTRPRAA
jgi:SulP family sulfate permease